MDIRTLILILTVGALNLTVMALPVYAESVIKVDPEAVNFGQVNQGEIAVAQFQVRNSGTDTATIQWMEFSSPGIVGWANSRIAGESSIEVTVNWNTGQLSGEVEGHVTLGIGPPHDSEVTFALSGNVIPADGETRD